MESRRRTPLLPIFPSQQPGTPPKRHSYPIVTSDGHGGPDDDEVLQEEEPQRQQPVATPVKKACLRPLFDQLLGRSWRCPMHEDDEGQFILFYLIRILFS